MRCTYLNCQLYSITSQKYCTPDSTPPLTILYYQYSLYVPKLTVISNYFTKILDNQFNANSRYTFYQYSLYVPKLAVILKFSFIFRNFINNKGNTRPSLGGIGSSCRNHPKCNSSVLYFYQYVLHIPKLTVIFNHFWKNLHSRSNAAQINASTHYQTDASN